MRRKIKKTSEKGIMMNRDDKKREISIPGILTPGWSFK
jgi:hypothetical protein